MASDGRERAIAEVTALLRVWNVDAGARDDALELLYTELKRHAARHLRRERADHTLSTTALVHESYLRLASQGGVWQNREQFLAVASRMMRRILVDHARARAANKRAALFVELNEAEAAGPVRSADLLELDDALDELSREDSASGATRGAALLQRHDTGRSGGRALRVAGHRRPRLAIRPRLAFPTTPTGGRPR